MDFTEVVFDEESGISTESSKRDALLKELDLTNQNNGPSKSVPLLSLALKQTMKTAEEPVVSTMSTPKTLSTTSHNLSQTCIDEATKKFEQYEKDHIGTIEKDDITNIFSELFPHFHRSMLDRFVYEECRAAEKQNSHSISIDEFLTMYKHLFDFCKKVVEKQETTKVETSTKAETETKTDSFLTFSAHGNRLPSLSPSKNVLNNHISTSFNKPEGNGILKMDQMSWNSDWNSNMLLKSPEPKSLSQHSSPRSNLLPTTNEEDPFIDDPFLPASSAGLKTFGRNDQDNLKNPAKRNGNLYQAKPITVIPNQSKDETAETNNVADNASDDNSVDLPNSIMSDREKKPDDDLKFEDIDDDYADDDFHSEGKTPRTTSYSEVAKSSFEEHEDLSSQDADDLKSEDSELAYLTTDKTVSQSDVGFDYIEDILSS